MDVIDLGAGDADLAPPPAVVAAIQRAVENPAMSRYPFQVGLPAFRREVSGWMERRFGVTADQEREVLPLIGSKDGLAHLPFGYLNPGDVAIIPDPGYQAYLGGTVLAGGEPYLVPLRPEHDFLIPLEAIPSDIVKRAKLLFLNYPNNPTAASAPVEYYRRAIDFCREHGVILVHDHAYSEIAFDGYRPPSILELEGAREVAIEFHSLSKTYNMTGWRLAWAVGNQELIGTLSRVKSFVDTGAFLGVQAAGVAALQSWESWVPANVGVFQARRDRAVDAFRPGRLRGHGAQGNHVPLDSRPNPRAFQGLRSTLSSTRRGSWFSPVRVWGTGGRASSESPSRCPKTDSRRRRTV